MNSESPSKNVLTKDDGYEEYEPLQPVTPTIHKKDVGLDQGVEVLSIASHSGDQLEDEVIKELKGRLLDEDNEHEEAIVMSTAGDVREEALDTLVDVAHIEVDDVPEGLCAHTPGTMCPDLSDPEVSIEIIETVDKDESSHIATGVAGKDSYLSLFHTTVDPSQSEMSSSKTEEPTISPGGASYLSLFNTEGSVIQMSPDDLAGVEEQLAVKTCNNEGQEDNEIVDIVVISQNDVQDLIEDRGKTNVEVLNEIINETENEEEKTNVKMLLQWAKSKSAKLPKTYTMKAKEARKMESFRKAVDVGSRNIVIFEKDSPGQIEQNDDEKSSKGDAETNALNDGITREFLEEALTAHEQGLSVTLLSMKFSKSKERDTTLAELKSQLGGTGAAVFEKSYRWIIKSRPRNKTSNTVSDLDNLMVARLGPKLFGFVRSFAKSNGSTQGKLVRTASIKRSSPSLPFHPLVYTNERFEVFDDTSNYKEATTKDGFDLPHVKLVVKSLAQLHAIGFAYLRYCNEDDKKEVLEELSRNSYHDSTSEKTKHDERDRLKKDLNTLLKVLQLNKEDGGELVAQKFESRFSVERILNINRDAINGQSNIQTLCHGFPTLQNFKFMYDGENSDIPIGVEIVDFTNARYTNPMTDLQLLFGTSLGPELHNRIEFLLRFVYHETLAHTLKWLKVNPSDIIEYEDLQKEFRRTDTFGKIASAMFLAGTASPGQIKMAKRGSTKSTQKSVYSKILGGHIGGEKNILNGGRITNGTEENTISKRTLELVQNLS